MELSEMTFLDVLQLSVFREELEEQLTREMAAWEKASLRGTLQRIALCSLRERGLFNVQDMTAAYYEIMHKEAKGFSSNERKYIRDVCGMAYQRTILRLREESEENDRNPLLRWVRHWWASVCLWFKRRKTVA